MSQTRRLEYTIVTEWQWWRRYATSSKSSVGYNKFYIGVGSRRKECYETIAALSDALRRHQCPSRDCNVRPSSIDQTTLGLPDDLGGARNFSEANNSSTSQQQLSKWPTTRAFRTEVSYLRVLLLRMWLVLLACGGTSSNHQDDFLERRADRSMVREYISNSRSSSVHALQIVCLIGRMPNRWRDQEPVSYAHRKERKKTVVRRILTQWLFFSSARTLRIQLFLLRSTTTAVLSRFESFSLPFFLADGWLPGASPKGDRIGSRGLSLSLLSS